MKHRYVDGSEGQLHVSLAGKGPPVLLLHWAPQSARMYEHEMPQLASSGYHAIAVDLLGFGRSDKPETILPYERQAQAVAEAVDQLGLERCAVLGAHLSAPIAVHLALTHRSKVTALMLDGCAHLLPAAAQRRIGEKMAAVKLKPPGFHEDGTHESLPWKRAQRSLEIYDPDFVVSEATLPLVYRIMADDLAAGLLEDYGTFQPYDMADALAQVTQPTLVLSAERDPLFDAQAPTVAALNAGHASVKAKTFRGTHPLHNPRRRGEYAGAVADFLEDQR
ncbi:MAG: alpha/beta fold hydrolase [Pseudomonadota bacterium]